MAIIRCTSCGAVLPLQPGVTVVECESCGIMQTVPSADNEKKLKLFERAERLLFACEFDKAAGVFETIVEDFPTEAEAYWGLVLSRYGIEYVDDPATGRKVPTCHRSSFNSVLDDSDFEQVLENADPVSRKLYREEAKQIDEIRKGIISVSTNEEPYDIFICYKETAADGGRTLDSVLAQDIYDQLTGKGYRVFFARITLEDKLGQEYEPYIFAALNSAKLMLVIGSDYEHFHAVWVKNEWSRFLKLMTPGSEKYLIPCYKGDIDNMPREFMKLQAQDLDKVGAVQDLLRGIEKLLPRQTAAATPEWAKVQGDISQTTVGSMLKRAFQFLGEENWSKANEYLEKALDIDPECAEAYMGKLMLEFKVMHEAQLGLLSRSISGSRNYQKVMQYGDPGVRQRLENYHKQVEQRIASHKAHVAELESKKQAVVQQVQQANRIMNDHHQRFAAAEQKVKARADQVLQATTQMAALEAEYTKKRNMGKNAGIPVWITLLAIVAVVALFFGAGYASQTDTSLICLGIGALVLIISGIRTSPGAAGMAIFLNLLLAAGLFLITTLIIVAIEYGGIIGTILTILGSLLDGLFGEKTQIISAEHWMLGRFLSSLLCLLITLIVSIVKGISASGERKEARELGKKLDQVRQTVNNLQADTAGEQQMIAAMEDARRQYHVALQACRQNIHAVNNDYVQTADKYRLKAEQLVPELYR